MSLSASPRFTASDAVDRQLEHIGDAQTTVADLQRFVVVPSATAHLADHLGVGATARASFAAYNTGGCCGKVGGLPCSLAVIEADSIGMSTCEAEVSAAATTRVP